MFAKAQKILYSLDNFQFAVYDSNLVYTRIIKSVLFAGTM